MSKYITYALVVIVSGGVVVGGLYFYKSNVSENQHFDSTIQDFSTKKALQAEKEEAILAQMKDTYNAQSQLNSIIVNKFQSLDEALHSTDIFFANPDSAHPTLLISVSKSDQIDINTLRQKINLLVEQIQKNIGRI